MNQNNSLINNMTEGPLFRQLVRFSIPIIVGNLLQTCYTIADMIIVGNFIGSDGLAAVGIGGLIQNLILSFAMGMGFGGQILLSQQVGAGESERLKKSIGTFMTLSMGAAVILTATGFAADDWLLRVLNTPEAILTQTKAYNLICYGGLFFIYGYNCVCSVLRGLGQSRLPMVFIAIASVVNIVLDIVFIDVFGMNVEGAALATVIAQGISYIISIVYLAIRREAFAFDFKPRSFIPDRRAVAVIMKLSLPIIIYGLMMNFSSMFINSNVNVYGVAASAVDSVGTKLNMAVNAVTMGLYMGSASVIGQCFGAGKIDRIRKTFWLTILMSIVVWAMIAGVLLAFTGKIFGLFTDDAEVLAIAPRYVLISVLMFFGMALVTGPFALFEGIGNTTLEMIAGIFEGLVMKVALSLLFSSLIGLYGYWLGTALAAFTTPVIGITYFLRGRWIERKVVMDV